MAKKTRAWCFTLWDPAEDGEELLARIRGDDRVSYVVFQLEIPPETDEVRYHYQGYISFKNAVRMMTVKETIGDDSAHVEPARGTPRDNRQYCTKETDRVLGPWEAGLLPCAGKRTDIAEFVDRTRRGEIKRWVDVMLDYPHVASHCDKFVNRVLATQHRRTCKPMVMCFWGKTGVGKSRKAWDLYPDAFKKDNSRWWDGYDYEETVIWDDFDDSCVPIQYLLNLLDWYAFHAEVKGAYVELDFKTIIFTSNTNPATWYPSAKQEHIDALQRRFNIVLEME